MAGLEYGAANILHDSDIYTRSTPAGPRAALLPGPMTGDDLSASAQKVQAALEEAGLPFRVVRMPATTRTAGEAAAAIGCTVAQIAKSILFRGAATGKPILVVASGANRVNERLVAELAGEPLAKADADFVRHQTGFAIGGVPPIGFPQSIDTWIDRDLMQHTEVWAAAGTPFTVFCLDPASIAAMTGGRVVRIR